MSEKVPWNIRRDFRECSWSFWETFQKILENIQEDSRELAKYSWKCSLRMRENGDQNNSKYRHFSRSELLSKILTFESLILLVIANLLSFITFFHQFLSFSFLSLWQVKVQLPRGETDVSKNSMQDLENIKSSCFTGQRP